MRYKMPRSLDHRFGGTDTVSQAELHAPIGIGNSYFNSSRRISWVVVVGSGYGLEHICNYEHLKKGPRELLQPTCSLLCGMHSWQFQGLLTQQTAKQKPQICQNQQGISPTDAASIKSQPEFCHANQATALLLEEGIAMTDFLNEADHQTNKQTNQ